MAIRMTNAGFDYVYSPITLRTTYGKSDLIWRYRHAFTEQSLEATISNSKEKAYRSRTHARCHGWYTCIWKVFRKLKTYQFHFNTFAAFKHDAALAFKYFDADESASWSKSLLNRCTNNMKLQYLEKWRPGVTDLTFYINNWWRCF